MSKAKKLTIAEMEREVDRGAEREEPVLRRFMRLLAQAIVEVGGAKK